MTSLISPLLSAGVLPGLPPKGRSLLTFFL